MFESFLKEIAPYVVIVGSFARSAENPDSDIDCFLRSRPVAQVDPAKGNETYMPEVKAIANRYGYLWTSVVIGHIAVEPQEGVERMVEISSHYRIPHTSKVFHRSIYGVDFLCAADNRHADYAECYDSVQWNDAISDNLIPYPLPAYTANEHREKL